MLRRWIGIGTCGGGFIRFRDNTRMRIGRYGSGNSWFMCRGNNSRKIGREISGRWNRRSVNRSIMISDRIQDSLCNNSYV